MTTNPTKTVLITGASSGIGEQTALRYAGRGCSLVLAARGADRLERVASACRAAGAADVLVRPTDIAERSEVEELFDAVVDRYGALDVVVQNAALAAFGRFTQLPADIFDQVIRTNVLGAANVSRCAICHFTDRGRGQLVVVGSVLGQAAVPYMGAYVVSKFAITALIRTLRQETRELPGIVVHGIYPGAVDTAVYGAAANYFGRRAHVLPINDPASKVARAIVAATESGRPSERQVGSTNYPMLAGYRLLPRVFDILVGPMMRVGSFARDQLPPTPGNAFKKTGKALDTISGGR
ncbi:SDR family NAD(P)-dependent oxidoreductase [Mycobacterium sp. Marseille-P9652]|uniref:SDR family NAD(P)-dependent oxidoreductase n=1 Tax=Mycobacterium sp. Marseille-P9652 TaxID=2654950 RepID=UPI0012E8E9F7|nr:SDR family NAD(P)-dependent oxidoreductase [Mycobacterium sp. Marseille-P9652]